MIEIESRFDILMGAVILTSLFLMCFTFLGIALNGQKVWRESNDIILYSELLIFSGSLLYVLFDSIIR